MPRTSNTEERRAQIAAALIKVMARRGYEAASINEIARTAGLTQGLVHYHFKSKREILLTVQRQLVARHLERLERRLAQAGASPARQLDALIDAHLRVGDDHADPEGLACWVVLSGEALRDVRVRRGYAEALAALAGRMESVIARGVDEGCFDAEPAVAAAALLAAIQGYYVLAAVARERIPRGTAAAATKRMAAGLLRGGRR